MAKKVHDDVLDAMLDKIGTATLMIATDAEPADRAAAVTNSLADAVMTGGDFTNANGDTSGRKVTVAQKASQAIDATGNANHINLVDASILLYVTTCTTQALTSGGTVTFPAWDIEVADPT